MKKIVVGFCFSFVVFASQAEYLWWQITDDTGMNKVGAWIAENGLEVDDVAARVVAVDAQGKSVGFTSPTSGFLDEWYTAPGQSIDLSSLDNASSYSYYVEIVNASSPSTVLGWNTKATSYAELASSGNITTTLSDIPRVQNIWHGGSGEYRAAPEPTSAMLMLLGMAGLALRRKQRKLA